MSWVAVAIVGGAVIGAVASNQSSKKQSEASDRATTASTRTAGMQLAELQRQYNLLREDLEPYRELGTQATEMLSGELAGKSQYTQSQGYQFQLAEGEKAINRLASQQGRLNTGAQAKQLQQYGQGLASQDYGNYYNRLLQAAGLGQNSAAQTGAAGIATGQGAVNVLANQGQAQQQNALLSGQARASAYQNYGNIANNALNQYMMWRGYQSGGQPASYYGQGNPNVQGDAYAPAYGS